MLELGLVIKYCTVCNHAGSKTTSLERIMFMNIRRVSFFIIVIILTGILCACSIMTRADSETKPPDKVSGSPVISNTSAPTSTPVPTITSTPTPTPTIAPTPTMSPTMESKARTMLSTMKLSEKVGQLFFVRLRKEKALEDIKNYKPGGYILFGEDFKEETKSSIRKLTASYQSSSAVPMLIGVDEEGGIVNRVSKYSAFRAVPFHSPMDLYKEGGFDLIRSDTLEKANLLLSIGINVNLAPICDVSTDPKDFIYSRSFGQSAENTALYVQNVIEVMKENKLGSTLKHFPGYGNNVDTHTGIAIDKRDYNTFMTSDFLPFEAGIQAGADSILVSHNIVTSIDKKYPASLSPKIHVILREDLNFSGVIMTDDLSMDAIKDYTGDEEAAVQAILAGNDLLIATNFEQQIPAVISAVEDGTIREDRLDESVLRVLLWKFNLGILK